MKYLQKLYIVGFIQALGLNLYIFGVISFMNSLVQGNLVNSPRLGPYIMLSIFVISALVCGLISLSYPLYLFFNQKVREGLKIVLWTLLFMFIHSGMFGLLIALNDKDSMYIETENINKGGVREYTPPVE